MAYLEQSTRYIAYDARLPSGHYRYHRPPEILDSPLGARYVGDMDRMFDAYAELLPQMVSWIGARHPRQAGDSDFVHRQAVRAKALDELRGLLPAASLSNVGIYGTGQSYELLLLRMRSHPLPEARHYAEMMLTELRKVIPSFLQRVDLAERGGEWSAYLATTRDETARVVERLWPDGGQVAAEEPAEVTLLDFDPEGEDKVLAAACFAHGTVSEAEALRRVRVLGAQDRRALLAAYVGERRNRRHRPGRAFERTDYRFEVVSDYGAFRDLQRHRMLTVEWQPLSTSLGYDVPELVAEAGLAGLYTESIERSADLHDALGERLPGPGPLRGGPGLPHPLRPADERPRGDARRSSCGRGPRATRPTAGSPRRCTGPSTEVAGHHAIAAAMSHVDHEASELERLEAERRAEVRRTGRRRKDASEKSVTP